MSLIVDLRRLCETWEDVAVEVERTEEDSEPIDDVGERALAGGGVDDTGLSSGSNGEQDGEA